MKQLKAYVTIAAILVGVWVHSDAVRAAEFAAVPIAPIEAVHVAEMKVPGLAVTETSLTEQAGKPVYRVKGLAGNDESVAVVDATVARVISVERSGKEVYSWSGIRLVGHRGTVKFAPENTLAGINKAIELGAHLIEIDIRETKDGHLVLMHDDTVDRTTNGAGPVTDLTLAELKELDAGSWFRTEFSGERVPTLSEALDAMAGRALPDLDFKAGDPAKLIDIVKGKQLLGMLTLYCGNWDLLHKTLSLSSAFHARPTIPMGRFGLAKLVEELDPPIVNMDWADVSETLIREVHLGGKKAFVNTMGDGDNAFAINAAIDAGADYIQSDHLDILASVAEQRGVAAARISDASSPATTGSLVGTSWQVGNYTLTFMANTEVLVRGGDAAGGLRGTYTLDNGTVAIDVMGTAASGTFDGQTLILDGAEGTKLQ